MPHTASKDRATQDRGFVMPAVLVAVSLLMIGGGAYIYENNKAETVVSVPVAMSSNRMLRVCPSTKILNQMPTTLPISKPTAYFIMNGQRYELDEFDQPWVAENCTVKVQTVY